LIPIVGCSQLCTHQL